MKRPIAITMGDPSGIGPEVIVKALARGIDREIPALVLGSPAIFQRAVALVGGPLKVKEIDRLEGFTPQGGVIPVYPVSDLDTENAPFGTPTPEGAKAAITCIEEAVRLTMQKKASAMVTAPINKKALAEVGFAFPGHTEFLASITDTKRFVMLMAGERLKVALATIHIPLAKVARSLTVKGILDTIETTWQGFRRYFGQKSPNLAVAGLNPHAGEGGLFGQEEETISRAVNTAQEKGYSVSGPYPPDTVFFRALKGEFDGVVAMFHDQGLIPFKLIHFHDGVNVTLGLPIIRTSVDHGTAYEIAGKSIAHEGSMVSALRLAALMVKNAEAELG